MGYHTDTHCHCGHDRHGSDHCPACGCEEYEATCDHTTDNDQCDCSHCDN